MKEGLIMGALLAPGASFVVQAAVPSAVVQSDIETQERAAATCGAISERPSDAEAQRILEQEGCSDVHALKRDGDTWSARATHDGNPSMIEAGRDGKTARTPG